MTDIEAQAREIADRHLEDLGARLAQGVVVPDELVVPIRATVLAALEEVLRRKAIPRLPLDPQPWVVHSMDSGDTRFATEAQCWLGYRHHFKPRDGYSWIREDYPHE